MRGCVINYPQQHNRRLAAHGKGFNRKQVLQVNIVDAWYVTHSSDALK